MCNLIRETYNYAKRKRDYFSLLEAVNELNADKSKLCSELARLVRQGYLEKNISADNTKCALFKVRT